MIGAGAAGQRIVGVGLVHDRLLKGNLQTAVGAVEADFLAGVFFHDLRNVFQNSSLCTAHAGVAGRIGTVAFNEFNAVALGSRLHGVALRNDGFIGQVTREGIVHQHVTFPLLAQVSNLIAAADFVVRQNDVGHSGDVGGVFGGNAGDQQDVAAAHVVQNLGEGSRGALNSLNKDDGLDFRITREGDQLGNRGFNFRGEVVRIGVVDHDVRILFRQRLGGVVFFFTLGSGAGHDGDLVSSTSIRLIISAISFFMV